MQKRRQPWRKRAKTRFRRLRRRFRAKQRKNTHRTHSDVPPGHKRTEATARSSKTSYFLPFPLRHVRFFLFFIPFAPHEPAKPSPMYCHDSPLRCGREQCITQATEPRDVASTTSKHLKAISQHKDFPHDLPRLHRHNHRVPYTLCASAERGHAFDACFSLLCTEATPLSLKTQCFLAFSRGRLTFLHVFS